MLADPHVRRVLRVATVVVDSAPARAWRRFVEASFLSVGTFQLLQAIDVAARGHECGLSSRQIFGSVLLTLSTLVLMAGFVLVAGSLRRLLAHRTLQRLREQLPEAEAREADRTGRRRVLAAGALGATNSLLLLLAIVVCVADGSAQDVFLGGYSSCWKIRISIDSPLSAVMYVAMLGTSIGGLLSFAVAACLLWDTTGMLTALFRAFGKQLGEPGRFEPPDALREFLRLRDLTLEHARHWELAVATMVSAALFYAGVNLLILLTVYYTTLTVSAPLQYLFFFMVPPLVVLGIVRFNTWLDRKLLLRLTTARVWTPVQRLQFAADVGRAPAYFAVCGFVVDRAALYTSLFGVASGVLNVVVGASE